MDIETNRENTDRSNETSSKDESGFRKFRSFKIPVKVGEEYDVRIEAMSKKHDLPISPNPPNVIILASQLLLNFGRKTFSPNSL